MFITDADGSNARPFLADPKLDYNASFSSDGQWIVFTSRRNGSFTSDMDGDYEVYTIAADGKQLTRLTHSPGNDAHSSWSPDGQWIAFATARGGFKDEAALHPVNPHPMEKSA